MTTKEKVIEWAKEKGLLKKDNSLKQALKMMEEVGEVANALLKGNRDELELEIGDVIVTLTILAKQNDLDLDVCFQKAYEKISKRKGETVDGVFVKDDQNDKIKYLEDYQKQNGLSNCDLCKYKTLSINIDPCHRCSDRLKSNQYYV